MELSRGTTFIPNPVYAAPASVATLERAAEALRSRGFVAHVAPDRASARELVLSLIPEGAEVGAGASNTLSELGVTEVIEKSGRYDALRPRLRAMDRTTQGREIRKLGTAPDFWINSAQALTESGQLVFASSTGSQLAPIVYGAGQLILVVGSQKVVTDLDAAIARLEDYAFPLEDAKMKEVYGRGSAINKVLILSGESRPDRVTVILVGEAIGN
jgi:hypothetical protein